MNERRFSLKDRLNMIPAQKMEEGHVYHITGLNKTIHTVKDKRTIDSIVVNSKEGVYFLPNTIANDLWTDEKHETIDMDALKDLCEFPLRCVSFTSKTYGTKGLTLVYAQEDTPKEDMLDI